MRKFLFPLLLATSVATPAVAQRHHGSDDNSAREERSDSRSDRAQAREQRRAEARQERSEARQERVARREQRIEVQQQQPADAGSNRPAVVERRQVETRNVNRRGRPTLDRSQVWQQRQRDVAADRTGSVANWRREQRQEARDGREDRAQSTFDRRGDRSDIAQRRERAPAGARPDRPAPLPQTALHRDRRDRHPEWRTSWRRDHRYDWRNHRRHHRSLFHVGVYFDPFGWGYQRYNVGWRLWPSYYGSSYWLNDPYMYRLPYAPWPYKWVRYYDDALRVNTITGQVADVIYDFFW